MTWYKCKLEGVLPTEDEFQVTYEWIAGTKNWSIHILFGLDIMILT